MEDGLNLCKYLGDILRMSIPLKVFLRAAVTAVEVLLDEVIVGEGDLKRREKSRWKRKLYRRVSLI